MRNEEFIIDLADPVFTKTIRSRQNDKNGLKMIVYVREQGKPVDLTGYVVKYEAINQIGKFVRDDAQLVDAKNGVFSYTFTSQAVSASDDWTAYFVMEKSAERMSTPDIRIVLRRDVKEGNIKIENYISEFDEALANVEGYLKIIDDTNKKIADLVASINANQLVRKKGDSMSGPLSIEHTGNDAPLLIVNALGRMRFLTTNDMNYIQSGTLDNKARNLLLTGYNGSTMDEVQVKTKKLTVEGIVKQSGDSDWTNLNTSGVTNVTDRTPKYKRSGEIISVIGSIRNPKNVTPFATLPIGFRPPQDVALTGIAIGDVTTSCEVTVQASGNIFVNNLPSGTNITVHMAANFMI
ncbi:BppU family phage baseplate upper protein [Bacillus nitratireducens]|uniref:BppU family phage baseplate upper protein n=1 Tax=Bacillus nitratireducens TaxID=2026193 RepID=UPI001BA520D7|nr:BppU family phage baseplate upper protein [Bacillus nitratireducens]QUG84007.1 BppU family phage baseplate upper protein [Bacillus nitratireducens]